MHMGIEDLAANALYGLLNKHNIRFITYNDLEYYGDILTDKLKEKGKNLVLNLSRDQTYNMYKYYSDYFEESTEDDKKGILLKCNISTDDLEKKFWGYLPYYALISFIETSDEVFGNSSV